jgi:hypothetical protein
MKEFYNLSHTFDNLLHFFPFLSSITKVLAITFNTFQPYAFVHVNENESEEDWKKWIGKIEINGLQLWGEQTLVIKVFLTLFGYFYHHHLHLWTTKKTKLNYHRDSIKLNCKT